LTGEEWMVGNSKAMSWCGAAKNRELFLGWEEGGRLWGGGVGEA